MYQEWSRQKLEEERTQLLAKYEECKAKGLKLDMSRGKPSAEQLDLTLGLLDCVNSETGASAKDNSDTRNYGFLEGLPEARTLMATLVDAEPEEVLVGGSSSLNLMYDTIARGFTHGFIDSPKPWGKEEHIKFLCVCPGYDRHFAITEFFGFELVGVDMTSDGADMDEVERLVAEDASIKGIWCVPKYSNPSGECYSDETVRRLARMKTAAVDFKIMWDNAYCVHDLYEGEDYALLNLLEECKQAGNPNRAIVFVSTSKISFPGAGVSAMGASKEQIAFIKKQMSIQTICWDKINMLRHVRYYKNMDGIKAHMKLQAPMIIPKFDAVLSAFEQELADTGIASWTKPRGGYFISFTALDGCAKRIVTLCKEAGVTLTPAGASYPYGKDPRDNNIRIAPTYPPMEELLGALTVFCIVTKLVSIEKILGE